MSLPISSTVESNAEVLNELASRLTERAGSVVPFVGAGISIPCGMPGWTGFLEYLHQVAVRRKQLNTREGESIHRLLERGHLEACAQRLYEALGDVVFRTTLQSQFRLGDRSIAGPIRRVVELADGLIITTNYDRVIETAWHKALEAAGVHRDVDPLLAASVDDLSRALTGTGHSVLKLHGDVEKPETWVLTSAQYTGVYGSTAFQSFLSRFFAAHVPLFLGCSMTEERLLTFMKNHRGEGYAILAAPVSEKEQRKIAQRLKDSVRVIWLRPEDVPAGRGIYDLLDPVINWLLVRKRRGEVLYTDTRSGATWEPVMDQFERRGQFREALDWILQNWRAGRSWELAVEYLKFSDLAGDPSGWRTYVTDLQPDLLGEPSPVTQHAIDYYYGRMLGVEGQWTAAFSRHRANRLLAPRGDSYQVLSSFEEGQLHFRAENFEAARPIFDDLLHLLTGQPQHVHVLVNVLKFLATVHVLDTTYDPPGSEGLWIKGRHSDPETALRFARTAQALATDAGFGDGIAWALGVSAFALEAMGDLNGAKRAYEAAITVTETTVCRATSWFHLRLYQSGFFRRQGQLDAAAASATLTAATLPVHGRNPDRLRLAEQRLLIAWERQDFEEGRRQFSIIRDTHRSALILLDGSTRLERRIRLLADDRRLSL